MPLTTTDSLSVICQLSRDPAQVGRARRVARETLPDWGLGEHVELAELVVSELCTNSLWHGTGLIRLRLSCDGGQLRIEVHDQGAARPVRRHAASDDEHGRGLRLLDGFIEPLGGETGVIDDQAGPGKTVYVTMPLPVGPAGTR